MLTITVVYADTICSLCGQTIKGQTQHWHGTKVTMYGIVPLVEEVREHKRCPEKAPTQSQEGT